METMKQEKRLIPQKIALELSEEVRIKNQKQNWPFGIRKMQCHFCWYFGRKAYNAGNPDKLCAFGADNNRGCWQINKLFDNRMYSQS